jgi:hypothetical protein
MARSTQSPCDATSRSSWPSTCRVASTCQTPSAIRAGRARAHDVGEPDPGSFDLPFARCAAQLLHELVDLAQSGRAERLALRQQATGRVDRDPAAERGVPTAQQRRTVPAAPCGRPALSRRRARRGGAGGAEDAQGRHGVLDRRPGRQRRSGWLRGRQGGRARAHPQPRQGVGPLPRHRQRRRARRDQDPDHRRRRGPRRDREPDRARQARRTRGRRQRRLPAVPARGRLHHGCTSCSGTVSGRSGGART